MRRVIGIAVGLAIFLNGCQAKIEPADLVGTYRVEYPYGVMHLIVKPDGTYEQLFAKDREPLASINRGEWKMIHLSGDINLRLSDPVIIDDGFGKYKPKAVKGLWQLRIRRSLRGRIYSPINEDQGFFLNKIGG